MHPGKISNIFSLSSEERYGYLLRTIAECEEIWVIRDKGKLVTLGDKDALVSIPVWPEKEFAEFFLADDWKGYAVESVEIYDFLEWLDGLQQDAIKIAGFPIPDVKCVVVQAGEMKSHLLEELQQYE